jgi:hypothetical protein
VRALQSFGLMPINTRGGGVTVLGRLFRDSRMSQRSVTVKSASFPAYGEQLASPKGAAPSTHNILLTDPPPIPVLHVSQAYQPSLTSSALRMEAASRCEAHSATASVATATRSVTFPVVSKRSYLTSGCVLSVSASRGPHLKWVHGSTVSRPVGAI